MVIRKRLQPNYLPGQQLACCPKVTLGQVFAGCPQIVDIEITNAGAVAGDYVAIQIKSNCGYCGFSYPNALNSYVNTWCSPLQLRFDVGDPLLWSPDAAASKFEELLNLDSRFNGLIYLERLSDTAFRLTARESWIKFEVEDTSEGFDVTVTPVRDSPSPDRIQYGYMVWLDECSQVYYPSLEDPNFTGFVAHCTNRHYECGGKALCRTYYLPGESIPVQERGETPIVVVLANIPTSTTDVLVFDPNNPPGLAGTLPQGSAPPPNGFILDGWTITQYVNNFAVIKKR